ncbi:hypothetical protein BK661_04100 [Pseudomonas frederiksbergensis]|jgi:hypothetical protein|uniref:Uncharacterized protein n=1 Tax=Pseudomonas frederiksbergensis TaxID=104087 RepID=A0A423JCY2_9PSED|nr:hypothetical protein BK661_04100 [Pseudomonas frederiksbergensis]
MAKQLIEGKNGRHAQHSGAQLEGRSIAAQVKDQPANGCARRNCQLDDRHHQAASRERPPNSHCVTQAAINHLYAICPDPCG